MTVRILTGDCIEQMATLPAESVQCCVTSPPYYGLRDYGVAGQIGLEATPEEYVAKMVAVFREVRRVLRGDGTLWLNIGDSYANTGKSGGGAQGERWSRVGGRTEDCKGTFKYAPPGLKPKDLIGIPWMLAFALRADGWWLRSDIIWHKPNPMPESVTDRPTKAHEYVFLMSKAESYYYDAEAVAEVSVCPAGTAGSWNENRDFGLPGGVTRFGKPNLGGSINGTRNARSVWSITTEPFADAHFATMPPALAEKCIRAGTKEGQTVLDPFGGAGTTGLVAQRLGRDAVLCELNPEYVAIAEARVRGDAPLFSEVRP